jgi:hypothetical protein
MELSVGRAGGLGTHLEFAVGKAGISESCLSCGIFLHVSI